MPKIKNIIIFIVIVVALVLIYVFFIKPSSSDQTNLVSSSGTATTPSTNSSGNVSGASSVGQDFLTVLLGVKNIQLNTDIFSDPTFISLHDSSVVLTPDATTGRTNPFAPFGVGNTGTTPTTTLPIQPTATSTQQIVPASIPAPVSVPPVVHKSTTATSTHP